MFLRGLEGWHIVIIVVLLALLFGAKRLPGAARSVGQSMRIFKSEMKAASTTDENGTSRPADAAVPPAPVISNSAAPTPTRVETTEAAPASRTGTSAQ